MYSFRVPYSRLPRTTREVPIPDARSRHDLRYFFQLALVMVFSSDRGDQANSRHPAGVRGHPSLALLAADQRRFAMADAALGPWDPMVPEDAAVEFGDWAVPWWAAGGWAIDLLLGHQTRAHGDLDILILRRDHGLVRTYLEGWDVCAADPPGVLRRWPLGETLPERIHDVWCRRRPDSAWEFQLMIDDAAGDEWIFAAAGASGDRSSPSPHG